MNGRRIDEGNAGPVSHQLLGQRGLIRQDDQSVAGDDLGQCLDQGLIT
ncbi:MAG: hypothetical protein WDM77_00885 [Steroidobacteraceae bacterium]